MKSTKIYAVGLLLGGLFAVVFAEAAPEKNIDLGDATQEYINIKGRIQTWSFTKVCIDGQSYLLIDGVSGPNGISPSFKDGKPEQCVIKKNGDKDNAKKPLSEAM